MDKNRTEFKLIAEELLKRDGKSIKDLADDLESEGLSYRTIYAYLKRPGGGGSLDVAARIALGMGKKLSDIYVPVGTESSSVDEALIENNDSDAKALMVLEMFVDFNNPDELSDVATQLGTKKLYTLAEVCNERATKLRAQSKSGKSEG